MKVSAIVSIYKAEKFIRGCLEDLVSQTLFEKEELEIVLVNSGSPENEEEIIKPYLDKYQNIVYIKTEEREGIYTAWNRGIKAASGEYITNANTDDRHKKDALETMANYLDKMSDVDLVYGDLFVTKTPNETFDKHTRVGEIPRPDFSVDIMLKGCHMGPQPMWRKSVHEKIGYFNDAYKSAGDYEFWLRMVFLYNSKMFHIREHLGLYLYNEQGIELGNQKISVYETNLIIDTYKKYIIKQSVEQKGKPIDIIFLTHNRTDYFFRTIDALIKRTRYPYRIIIVDNASNDDFRTFLKQTEILYDKIIYNDKNAWTSAFQKGIEVSESDPFIVSDPDILVPEMEGKCWLERVLELHEKHSELGLLALNLDDSNKPAKLPDVYLGEKKRYNDEIILSNVGTVMQSIKRKYFNFPYLTDWETCERIRKNGGLVGFAEKIKAYHLGWNEEKDYPDYIIRKYKYFKENYNVDTYKLYTENENLLKKMDAEAEKDYYSYSRPEVRKLVDRNSRKILDVGCGSGTLGAKLKEELNDAEVWGIEIVENVAHIAEKKLDKVLIGDINEKINELPDNYFDTIIFADVLEHLPNPEKIVKLIASKLQSNGEIIASIPNVRHWTVIKALLEGTWQYEDAGILDRTHLRFFTEKTAAEMFFDAGFKIEKIEATVLNEYKFPDSLISKLKSEGFAVDDLQEKSQYYQFIFKVRKNISATIIIPVYNQACYLKEMLNSLKYERNHSFETIIIDNASNNETKEVIENFRRTSSNVKVITNEENLGFPKAINQGLRIANTPYIVIANSDIVLTENWLSKMIAHAERKDNIGIVGVISNKVSGVQKIKDISYSNIDEMHEFAKDISLKHQGESFEFPRVAFLCTLIKREVIETIGGLDERFTPGNYEDDDFCLRAQLAGFKTIIALDVFIHHYGSKSFGAEGKEKYYKLLEKNKQKFIEKWGYTPDEIWLQNKKPKWENLFISVKSENDFYSYIKNATKFIEIGKMKEAKENLEKALGNYDPNFNIEKERLEELLNKVNQELNKK